MKAAEDEEMEQDVGGGSQNDKEEEEENGGSLKGCGDDESFENNYSEITSESKVTPALTKKVGRKGAARPPRRVVAVVEHAATTSPVGDALQIELDIEEESQRKIV